MRSSWIKRALVALPLAALFGCATVEVSSRKVMDKFDVAGSDEPAIDTVVIRNGGLTLLYWIPFVCGDITWEPGKNGGKGGINGGIWLFRNRCNVADGYETLQCMAEQRGCDLTNVTLEDNSLSGSGVCTGYADLIRFLIENNEVVVSGVLRPRKAEARKGARR